VAQDDTLETDDFAERLQLALNGCNLSRSQLSATLGVHKSLVSRWLSGDVKPTSYNLARISEMLARLKPGFNMTLWTAPLAEFEAFLGISHSAFSPPAGDVAEAIKEGPKTNASLQVRNQPLRWAFGALGALALIALAVWGLSTTRDSQRVAAASGANTTAAIPSVAVLPFLNMSGDPAKDYLGDGIAEEILNDLGNTPGLQVASRTSSFSFRNKSADISEIARKLNVRAVLEGSVRQQGNRIRIVAQLINAANGFHLWSASYDRKLDDTLAVQNEIARAIVVALTQKLAPPRRQRSIEPKAYQDYLQAQYFFNQRTGPGLRQANELLKDALTRQPDFAAAYALRGHVLMLFTGIDDQLRAKEAMELTATALRLDPDNREALDTELQQALRMWNWNLAARDGQRLLAQTKRDALTYNGIAFYYQYMGFPLQALEARRQATQLDPLQFAYRNNVALALWHVGRVREAIAAAEATLEFQPGTPAVLAELCTFNSFIGNIARARDYAQQLAVLNTSPLPVPGSNASDYHQQLAIRQVREFVTKSCEIESAFKTEPLVRVHARLDRTNRFFASASDLGVLYARAGDMTEAMKQFSQAYEHHEEQLIWFRYDAATPKAVLQDPRWIALWRQPKLQDWQRYHDRIAADLAAVKSR